MSFAPLIMTPFITGKKEIVKTSNQQAQESTSALGRAWSIISAPFSYAISLFANLFNKDNEENSDLERTDIIWVDRADYDSGPEIVDWEENFIKKKGDVKSAFFSLYEKLTRQPNAHLLDIAKSQLNTNEYRFFIKHEPRYRETINEMQKNEKIENIRVTEFNQKSDNLYPVVKKEYTSLIGTIEPEEGSAPLKNEPSKLPAWYKPRVLNFSPNSPTRQYNTEGSAPLQDDRTLISQGVKPDQYKLSTQSGTKPLAIIMKNYYIGKTNMAIAERAEDNMNILPVPRHIIIAKVNTQHGMV